MQNCMPLHGSKPSQATPTPRSLLRQCRSHCFAGSGSNSCSHLVPMLLETMHFRALELASWQGGPDLWSGPGARLPVKPWGRRHTWRPNNGSSTPLRQASRPTTAGASTSSFTAPHHWVVHAAVIRPSSRLSRAMASPTAAWPRRMEGNARAHGGIDHVDRLPLYWQWQPVPRLHPTAYGRSSHSHDVLFWVFSRRGHHDFAEDCPTVGS